MGRREQPLIFSSRPPRAAMTMVASRWLVAALLVAARVRRCASSREGRAERRQQRQEKMQRSQREDRPPAEAPFEAPVAREALAHSPDEAALSSKYCTRVRRSKDVIVYLGQKTHSSYDATHKNTLNASMESLRHNMRRISETDARLCGVPRSAATGANPFGNS